MKNNHLITTVINYRANDLCFAKKGEEEKPQKNSFQTMVPISDHLFNKGQENKALLINTSYLGNPSLWIHRTQLILGI